MDKKSIVLVIIIILVVALAALGIYFTSNNGSAKNVINLNTSNVLNITDDNDTSANTTDVVEVDNETVVGDNSTRVNETVNDTTNSTYKVYNPQSDSYVPVIGEKYDEEVNRWYTYDAEGVRYYNTRINQ